MIIKAYIPVEKNSRIVTAVIAGGAGRSYRKLF